MSEQKDDKLLTSKASKKQKDSAITKKIGELYSGLSSYGKEALFWSMVNTKDSYKKKSSWSPKENMILRAFFGKIHPDEICEFFECSYSSFMDQCQAIGVLDLSEGRQLCAEDLELFYKLLDRHSVKEVCEIFDMQYEKQYDMFIITPSIETELNKLKEQVGLVGFFDED